MSYENDRPTKVVGCFTEPEDAQSAIRRLREAGISDRSIGVVTRGDRGEIDVTTAADRDRTEAGSGAATGAAVGAGGGALWAIGVAAGIVPPIGPVIAGGLLSAVLASAAGGAAAGSVAGAFIGLGIPADHAGYFEEELRRGSTIVIVDAGERMADALEILRSCGSYNRYEAEYVPHPPPTEGTGQTRLQPE